MVIRRTILRCPLRAQWPFRAAGSEAITSRGCYSANAELRSVKERGSAVWSKPRLKY